MGEILSKSSQKGKLEYQNEMAFVAHKSGELLERSDEVGPQRAKVPTG